MTSELPVLRFESRITRTDYLVHFLRHNLPDRWSTWITAVGAAVAMAVFGCSPGSATATRIVMGGITFVASLVLLGVVATVHFAFRLWRLPADGPVLGSRTLTIDERGYHATQAASDAHFAWSALDKLMVSRRFLRIRIRDSGDLELLVPRRDLPPGGEATIRAYYEASRVPTTA